VRAVYRVLAWLIAIEVVVQAAVMVWGVAGLGIWIDTENGVLDRAAFESGETLFPEMAGLAIHGMNGMMVIPALALLLLIVSFFAKVPGGVTWAGLVLLTVVAQVFLGIFGHEVAVSGLLHGVNAMVLFALAAWTGIRASATRTARATAATGERELV
jgi:hypothetical protein